MCAYAGKPIFRKKEPPAAASGLTDARCPQLETQRFPTRQDSASFLEEKPVPEALDAEGIPKMLGCTRGAEQRNWGSVVQAT